VSGINVSVFSNGFLADFIDEVKTVSAARE
jgi:hypothetical protein